MKRIDEVIQLLADGQFHSGEDIGKTLGISRSAIWKITKQLDDVGIEIHRVQGRGYCIPGGIQFYSEDKLKQFLSQDAFERLKNIAILNRVNSTNAFLQEKIKEDWTSASLCLAEYQSEGKGRRDRSWLSPYGKNIYMSLVWEFVAGPGALNGLTLLVGLAIIKALSKFNITGLSLKWPNDVMWNGNKLAGVLTEINVDDINGCQAIIGIGLNLHLPSKIRNQLHNQITDMQTILGAYPDKNYITALILEELLTLLPEFESKGFEHFVDQWRGYDHLLNKQIILHTIQDKVEGVAQGVDHTGALEIKVDGNIKKFYSGEASIGSVAKPPFE